MGSPGIAYLVQIGLKLSLCFRVALVQWPYLWCSWTASKDIVMKKWGTLGSHVCCLKMKWFIRQWLSGCTQFTAALSSWDDRELLKFVMVINEKNVECSLCAWTKSWMQVTERSSLHGVTRLSHRSWVRETWFFFTFLTHCSLVDTLAEFKHKGS